MYTVTIINLTTYAVTEYRNIKALSPAAAIFCAGLTARENGAIGRNDRYTVEVREE